MKKKLLSLSLCVAMALMTLTACGKSTEVAEEFNTTTESKQDKEDLDKGKIKVNDNFKTNEEYEISSEYSVQNITNILDYLQTDPTSNVVVSETSLNMALSLLLEGADEDTEAYNALVNYLRNSNYSGDVEDIRIKNNAIMSQYLANEDIRLHLANSIWSNTGFNIKPEYQEIITSYYNGQAQTLDFMDPSSVDIINNWVAENTNNKINSIVDQSILSKNDNILVNALYFLGDWLEPFEDSACKTENFTNADGTVSEVTMMHKYGLSNYFESDYAEGFMLPYNDPNIVFVGILPKEEGSFSVSELNIDDLLSNESNKYSVHIALPQFKLETTNSLYEVLNDNGLAPVFSTSSFNKLSDSDMIVSDVIQKTYIDVNAQGTEAAAVTAVISKTTSIEEKETREIILNRPFVFMIYDRENHEVLFIGKINQL